ncbi:MAG: exopolysaccharide biosynthesis polyprenyl glycosylphosphotransferase [Opitutus sp.]|nr:exopolysaccharide biosynthesis polyprenyl glycosylphosphotransferase [Opitutus sp.]
MNRARRAFLVLLTLDVLAVLVVFNLVGLTYLSGTPVGVRFILTPLLVPLLIHVVAIYLIDGYSRGTDMMSLDYTSQHSIALLTAMATTLLLTFAVFPGGYELQSSRVVVALSYLLLIPVTLVYRRALYRATLRRRGRRSLVFLGDHESYNAFRNECERLGAVQPLVFASLHPVEGGNEPVAQFADVLDRIQSGDLRVEAIVLRESNHELAPDVSRKLVQLYFSGVPTYTLELFHQVYWRKIPLYRLNQTWLFQEGFQIAREPVFERAKRVADVVLSLIGLFVAAPFILVGATAIWLEDRGPVFFRQNRVGKNHVTFRLHKLRTMRVSDQPGDLYTQPGDARITRVGKILRQTRVDEFPQLWNVLRGDMSLIGPRAEWDRLVENYEQTIPCYHFRHLVKPGITGWAQVNYPYGASTEDTIRKLEYDLFYIRHFSFMLDASIVLKTVHIMLFGKGR